LRFPSLFFIGILHGIKKETLKILNVPILSSCQSKISDDTPCWKGHTIDILKIKKIHTSRLPLGGTGTRKLTILSNREYIGHKNTKLSYSTNIDFI
jgi:hypothetical protein